MIQVFTGDPLLAREALLAEARHLGIEARMLPPEPSRLWEEAGGGLFGSGALLDLRELPEGGWKALREVLEALPPSARVLILDPRPTAARSRWYEERVERRACPAPSPAELPRWIENRARSQGLKLPSSVARYLASLVDLKEDWALAALDQELAKLALWPPPLTVERIRPLLAWQPPTSAFDLIRALNERQVERVWQLMERLFEVEEPLRILGALTWQYAHLARTWALVQDEPQIEESALARRLALHPYVARQLKGLAQRLSRQELMEALRLLVMAERAVKRGELLASVALEGAIWGLLSGQSGAWSELFGSMVVG
jgi:DNA polymerase-3 subunit delta